MTAPVVWILDANIVAKMMRANPNQVVVEIVAEIVVQGVGLSIISVWEVLNGISQLDLGERRKILTERFYRMLDEMSVDRILDWTLNHPQTCA